MVASRLGVRHSTAGAFLKVQFNVVNTSVGWNTSYKDAASPRYLLDGNHLTFEWSTNNQSSQCSVVCTAVQHNKHQ